MFSTHPEPQTPREGLGLGRGGKGEELPNIGRKPIEVISALIHENLVVLGSGPIGPTSRYLVESAVRGPVMLGLCPLIASDWVLLALAPASTFSISTRLSDEIDLPMVSGLTLILLRSLGSELI